MVLATVGRGGDGNQGQRIRDEILSIQSRNGCKGGMMVRLPATSSFVRLLIAAHPKLYRSIYFSYFVEVSLSESLVGCEQCASHVV